MSVVSHLTCIWLLIVLTTRSPAAQTQSRPPVFTASTNLQSVAVQVTGKGGRAVHGLTASDFTLLENGRPQKIAFFEAEKEPISLAILIDSGRTMQFGGKLDRAHAIVSSLARAERPQDEIFLMPFTDVTGPFEQLTSGEDAAAPGIATVGHAGSALYDALSTALCHMRTAKNIRQAVVVITDGVDENSRLGLDQLIDLVRASSPQVFVVGLYSRTEFALFQLGHKTVPIVGMREIDNPLLVFRRLAKESGAESFFPSSDKEFQKALMRISALLDAEYTLAYYPQEINQVRKLEIKVKRGNTKVSARRTIGSQDATKTVRFTASGCTVSPSEHPYPWESRVSSSAASPMTYREDFSDPRSGWPRNHNIDASERYLPGGGYEISRLLVPRKVNADTANEYIVDPFRALVAAYGPWWHKFRAQAYIDAHWARPNHAGLFFDVNESGYYALLLAPPVDDKVVFELVKGNWSGAQWKLIPPTPLAELEGNTRHKLAVEVTNKQISVGIDNHHVGMVEDLNVHYGLIGFGLLGDFGGGRIVAHDLHVEALP